jgi:hypothetical protein
MSPMAAISGYARTAPAASTVSTSPMNQRARSKSWMPMSTMMPPLLAGFAYSRLGRNGSRDDDLKTTGLPIAPCSILPFAAAYPGSNRRMNPI